MSEQLYRYVGDIEPELWSQDYKDNWVPLTVDDITNSPELTELLWNVVYGVADDE